MPFETIKTVAWHITAVSSNIAVTGDGVHCANNLSFGTIQWTLS